jgi:two-component system phosphate regulon sensor histidine kinase PhoR
MSRSRFWLRQLPYYLAAFVLTAGLLGWLANSAVKRIVMAQVVSDLAARTELVKRLVESGAPSDSADWDAICKYLGRTTATRITLIHGDGRVWADSDADPLKTENHSDRPEFIQALREGLGTSIRYSPTLGLPMVYVASPVKEIGSTSSGVVRVAVPLSAVQSRIDLFQRMTAPAAAIFALLLALYTWVLVGRYRRPLQNISDAAQRFASGEMSHRLNTGISAEFRDLAVALNETAAGLENRIATITLQRNQLESVLTSMVEGVIAVDREQRLLMVNRAAAGMLAIDPSPALGRLLSETTRNPDLTRFTERLMRERRTIETELIIGDDRHFQTHGTPLIDASGRDFGALVVMNDVTKLKRLETIRRDFAANVSHEMRTPLTAVKGFVETLQDGAIADPDAAHRFLDIIARHIDRLNATIEDLLQLARIELDVETSQIELTPASVKTVLEDAVRTIADKADEKKIPVQLDCADDLTASLNPPLLERAVTNLIDNAINHSESGRPVKVMARMEKDEVVLQVIDQGCGIAARHQPRLFERFYRVDTDRSRKLGGTGLGLALVKHITLAHRGRVSVSSKPGEGSTFRIHLPVR